MALYVASAAVAGVAAYCFTQQWITAGLALVAAGVAMVAALFGVFMIESVIESLIVAAILGGAIAVLPRAQWACLTAIPACIGVVVGKVAVGAWKEFRA